MNLTRLIVIVATIVLHGCATIVSQSEYQVTVVSCPPGAEFVIQNQDGESVARGITPMPVTLGSSDGYFNPAGYEIYFRKSGYQDESVTIEASIDGWYFGSILPIPLLIFVVDPLTGAMWKLPGYASTSLKPKEMTSFDSRRPALPENAANQKYICAL